MNRMPRMTRTYCAIQLLKHGEMTFSEFVEITGWTVRQCRRAIEKLQKAGQIFTSSKLGGRSVYSLVAMRELVTQ